MNDVEANNDPDAERDRTNEIESGRLTPAMVEGSNEVPLSRSNYVPRTPKKNGSIGRSGSFRSNGAREKEDRGFLSEGYRYSRSDDGRTGEGSRRD